MHKTTLARHAALALALSAALEGCGSDESSSGSTGGAGTGASATSASTGSATSTASSGATGGGGPGTGGAGGTGAGGGAPIGPRDLLALVGSCNVLAGSTQFKTDAGEASTVDICTLTGAVWWQADMDIDCDGGLSATCQNDPYYSPDTSASDSQGNPLDASTLPFVVVPLASNGFDFKNEGLELGSVVAVLYQGQLQYGILGDQGPKGVIGEASYAMADLFGIDPDPETGGVDSGVTYIAFTGANAVVTKNEDHAEAEQIGAARAAEVVQNN